MFFLKSYHSLHLFSQPLNQSKLFIFDFDGTLCDSFEAGIKAVNDQSDAFGYRKIQTTEVPRMRDFTMQEALKDLGISNFKLPFVARKIRKELYKEMDFLLPYEGIREALLSLKTKDYAIGILTSNSQENVLRFIKKNNLELFDFIYSGSSVFGKDRIIKKLLKNFKISVNNAIYVGDETRDIQAAKSAGISIIAVSWGFNSKKALQAHLPDYLIESVSELGKF